MPSPYPGKARCAELFPPGARHLVTLGNVADRYTHPDDPIDNYTIEPRSRCRGWTKGQPFPYPDPTPRRESGVRGVAVGSP